MHDPLILEKVLGHNERLPTLPGIAIKILEAVQRDRPDLREISEVLATDPPLSAEVLRLVNSSLYSLPCKVTSVFHAVNMLGMNTVKNLALSFALIKQHQNGPDGHFDYPQFWKNSLTAAVSARLIAERIAPKKAEDAFFIGLLHDMGLLALARCMPDQYRLVENEIETAVCARRDAERQILGFDHMAVGHYLLTSWGLPEYFCLPVASHHDPQASPVVDAEVLQMSRILHLATLYADLFRGANDSPHLGLIDHYARQYGFDKYLPVDDVGTLILEQTRQIFPFFELDIKNESEYLEIVDRARAALIHVSNDFINQVLAQQQQIQMLRRQATHDGLTQLMNYQFFHETLGREIARSRRRQAPLTVIMADIDRFKDINDTYGHPAGDRAIQTVAEVLRTGLRETDSIARYGGEEFTMILFNIPPKEAIVVAERIRQKISDTEIVFENHSFRLTVSFGIATMWAEEDDLSKEALISRADKALYRAKSEGRNCCRIYHPRPKCTAAAS